MALQEGLRERERKEKSYGPIFTVSPCPVLTRIAQDGPRDVQPSGPWLTPQLTAQGSRFLAAVHWQVLCCVGLVLRCAA